MNISPPEAWGTSSPNLASAVWGGACPLGALRWQWFRRAQTTLKQNKVIDLGLPYWFGTPLLVCLEVWWRETLNPLPTNSFPVIRMASIQGQVWYQNQKLSCSSKFHINFCSSGLRSAETKKRKYDPKKEEEKNGPWQNDRRCGVFLLGKGHFYLATTLFVN